MEAWVRLEVTTEGGVEGGEELPIGEDRTKVAPSPCHSSACSQKRRRAKSCASFFLPIALANWLRFQSASVVLQRVRDGVVELLSQGDVAS